jgi:cytochrome P450
MEGFFSPVRIQEHAETMVEVAQARTGRWVPGETIRLDEEMRSLALQNLFEVILGQSLADDELDEVAEVANALNLWFKPTSWALPDWVPTPARYRFRRGSIALRERARELLERPDERPSEDSLLATLSQLRADPDSGFDRAEVLDQAVGMLFAGHETTALAMTYALQQIGSHPDVAERLQAEIDATVEGTPSLSDLRELTYLDQVVSETLRLYPPVHAIPRVTTAAVDVGGFRIPDDEQVLLSVWSIHRDARFYDAPLTFDPDRWAETSPRAHGYAFVPFGAGPRICIGRHFARIEMKATLTVIAQRYRLETEADIALSPQMTTQPDEPVTAEIKRRASFD